MNFVFFGGKESRFAQIVLDGLSEAGERPLAEIREAKKLIDIEYLKSLNADFFLVASFAKILKKEVIEIPSKGTIGIHPSLLPKYRGPSPIQSAILNNEKETGATLFLIDEKVDHGPIVSNIKYQVSDEDTYASLEKKLAKLSANLIIKELSRYISGEIKPQEQNHSDATFTKKFSAKDAVIDLNDNSEKNWLKIKALNPEPGTYTILKLKNGKDLRLKILEANLKDNPGRTSKLKLITVQPEGKRPMPYSAFLNGYQKRLLNTFIEAGRA